MNFSKLTTLSDEEIKLFKDDPETFREYLKFKTRQMEIANDIDTKNHEERMKAIDAQLEENDRKRKAEAEADERKYKADAEARECEMQKIIEANDRREKIWAMAICGVGTLCEFLEQKNSNTQIEKNKITDETFHRGDGPHSGIVDSIID